MTTAIVGATGFSGAAAAAAVAQVQPKAATPAAAATTSSAAAAEDSVTISATAQEVHQPTAAQVRLLRNEGKSVPQIATQLKISAREVQNYLGTAAAATK
jgi:DNA-binding NarL/FixJ family response regulator